MCACCLARASECGRGRCGLDHFSCSAEFLGGSVIFRAGLGLWECCRAGGPVEFVDECVPVV